MKTGIQPAEVGARLKLARKALGLSGTAFAGGAGIRQNAYSQYETGDRPLTINAAVKLCVKYRLSLDYLYLGDETLIPRGLNLSPSPAPAALEPGLRKRG